MGKENSPPRDSSKSIGFGTGGGGAATGCRKGRKALVPWRFQVGYKRTWSSSQGLSPINNGSDGPPGIRGSSKFEDGSRQCAPATARKRSRVQVSAAAAQVQRGSASSSVPKEKKITPKNRVAITRESVMASLHEFRVIYRALLEEEKSRCSKQEDGTTHDDLAAFRVFRERFCVEHGDKRYEGSLPGVQVGDVFDSTMELFLVGLHRSQDSCVDYVKKGRACLAVSIVSYAQHSALNHNLDFLLHVGSTASTADQKMEGTDMALKRSMDTNTKVRVIYRSVAHLGEHSRSEGGELVKDEDAEKTENDEYLFNIGHNYYNVSRWDNLLKTIPSLRNGPGEAGVNDFAVDALKCGNFARFINHSCSANLFSQNVLYDHDNKSMPHIALFADVDIPPLQPLSYDYNYTIDGVRDPQDLIMTLYAITSLVDHVRS
ncbi:hypothetical protein ACQ4PT_018429 [Festuca glaucescens]